MPTRQGEKSKMELIYKIAPAALWRQAQDRGRFDGSAVDLKDGFIHFSTAAQVEETARLHFAGLSDLVLIAVNATRLGADLRFEASRGGALFPHLYAPLPLDSVASVKRIPRGAGGVHDFSGLIDAPAS
ncbi:dihydroorotate dehydrogenase [Methylocella silvestris]|uniref:Dihydroorotate dehydrogenase n=2 Tax=Methylocella silvestris TaxID=199596 RepID=A0A2J7TM25_METSI|nr:dihydroorotate dehydrogenase [Methylocella silvestris]